MNETLYTLCHRRSIRKYRPEQVKEEELNAILEAGTWAPTGMGLQSPLIIAIQDPETIALLEERNAEIQKQPGGHPFYGAPTVVAVVADGENPNWLQDGSLVMGNMMNAAYSLGVGSCWVNRAKEFFDTLEGKRMLARWNIDRKYRGVGFCLLGYADCDDPVPKPRKEGYIHKI